MNNVQIIKDTRFKNVNIQVRMIAKLEEEKVTPRLVLAYLLNDVCEKYDTKQKLSNELDRLYGTNYRASSSVVGNAQVFIFKTKSIHPKFIHHKIDLVKAQCELLNEFINHPLLEDGCFPLQKVEEAKRNVKNSMQRMIDDPSSLCMHKAMRYGGKNQPLGFGVSDDLSQIDTITPQQVYELYKELVNDLAWHVLVLGDIEQTDIEQDIRRYLPLHHKLIPIEMPSYTLQNLIEEDMPVQEKQMTQSYLTSIYTTQITNQDKDYAALRIANIIFGQIPSSLLFQELREKQSLCYSIYSTLQPYDGALMVSTGVDTKNIEQSKNLIAIQLKRMQTLDFDPQLLDVAKKMLINSFKSSRDDIDAIFALSYRNILAKQNICVDQLIDGVVQVSLEDVKRVMNQVEHVCTYTLKGVSDNEEALS